MRMTLLRRQQSSENISHFVYKSLQAVGSRGSRCTHICVCFCCTLPISQPLWMLAYYQQFDQGWFLPFLCIDIHSSSTSICCVSPQENPSVFYFSMNSDFDSDEEQEKEQGTVWLMTIYKRMCSSMEIKNALKIATVLQKAQLIFTLPLINGYRIAHSLLKPCVFFFAN